MALIHSVPSFKPVHCSLSGSVTSWPTYRFLRKQVTWSDIPSSLRIFHSFCVYVCDPQRLYLVNEAEVDDFLELPFFCYDLPNVGNLISGSSAFSQQSFTSENSLLMYCWRLAWRFLSITLTICEMHCKIQLYFSLNIFLSLSFFEIEIKTDIFQACGHWWIFQICWHIEWSTLTASSFRIWNSSAEIPSPPLAMLFVLLPQVHLTLHSMISGSRWLTTPSWLSRSLRSFLYSSSVFFFS